MTCMRFEYVTAKTSCSAGDVPLGLNVQRELLTSTNNTVSEKIAVVLGRTVRVADDGQLLVNHHTQTCEQSNLSAGQADST